MTRKSFAVTAVLAALASTAAADVPDGAGGRTSPQGLSRPPVSVTRLHACCDAVTPVNARVVASSPAELKARGHLASVARPDDPAPAATCSRRVAHRPARYGSPAEQKGLGHVAARNVVDAPALITCCETGWCPMRTKAIATR